MGWGAWTEQQMATHAPLSMHPVSQEADMVFSPYSYLVDPVIRRALDISAWAAG